MSNIIARSGLWMSIAAGPLRQTATFGSRHNECVWEVALGAIVNNCAAGQPVPRKPVQSVNIQVIQRRSDD